MNFRIFSNGRRRLAQRLAIAGLFVASALFFPLGETPAASAGRPIASITFVGHGYGPGIGMGQWGAFGYAARYHFGYEEILDRYYGDTSVANLSSTSFGSDPLVSVAILENVGAAGTTGYDPVITSPSAFTLVSSSKAATPTTTSTTTSSTSTTTSSSTSTTTTSSTTTSTTATSTTTTSPSTTTTAAPTTTTNSATTDPISTSTTTSPAATLPSGAIAVPAGTAVDLRLTSAGTWDAYRGSTCTAARQSVGKTTPLATGLVNPLVEPANSARSAPPADLLTLCRHDGVDEVVRGSVEAYDRQGYERTLNVLPLQSYLDGVVPAEEPASWGTLGGSSSASQGRPWGFQALEAQAVAARSYAIAYGRSGGWNDYATICDDVDCQLYVGASFENPISNAAVALTAGEVRDESGTGSVVMTRYSASSGGWTAPGSFPAVFDRGDACVSPGAALACNPSHVWQATVNASALDRRLRSLGPIIRVTVTRRNHLGTLGGRALLVRVTGARRSEVLSGDQFAALAGLRSDWFAVASIRN